MAGVVFGWAPQHARIVCIGNDVALVGAVVHTLGECVRNTKLEGVAESAVPGHLERVICGIGDVIGLPNGAEPLKRPDGVDIDAWICCGYSQSRMIDVGLSLQMQAAASNVPHT